MKKTWGLMVLVVIVAGGVSFAMARWVASCHAPATVANLRNTAWLKRELNLSAAQAEAIGKLEGGLRAELAAACQTHCAARMALGDELLKPQPDAPKCQACVENMNTAQATAERVTLAHILKVRAMLDERQAQRYCAMIHDQVCSMPMGTP
jgi:hypothetical protein